MNGSSSRRHFFSTSVGRGSSEHDFVDDRVMTDWTSLAGHSWKWSKISVAVGSSVVTLPPAVAFCTTATFDSKKSSNCWADGQFFSSLSCHWFPSTYWENARAAAAGRPVHVFVSTSRLRLSVDTPGVAVFHAQPKLDDHQIALTTGDVGLLKLFLENQSSDYQNWFLKCDVMQHRAWECISDCLALLPAFSILCHYTQCIVC